MASNVVTRAEILDSNPNALTYYSMLTAIVCAICILVGVGIRSAKLRRERINRDMRDYIRRTY
jgi:hypothetical protein